MNKRNGFTLVELIVVMVIIGILSAIAIPNYTQYVQKANNTKIEANASAIEEAVLIALVDLEASGDGKGDTEDLVNLLSKHVNESLSTITNIIYVSDSNNSHHSATSWVVIFEPVDFTSIDQITEFTINSGDTLNYTGEYLDDRGSYTSTIKLK